MVLVNQSGRIVEKEKLMKEVWGDSFVEDSNLTYSIRQLRKILDDDFHRPIFIETIPRRGYRFIGNLRIADDDQTPSINSGQIENISEIEQRSSWGRWILLFGVVAILLGATTLVATRFNGNGDSSPGSEPMRFSAIPIAGTVRQLAISRSGKLVAYVTEIGNRETVWLRDIDTQINRELPDTGNWKHYGMVFSADDESLFLSRRDTETGPHPDLVRIVLSSGEEQKIADNIQGWIGVSPDNKRVSFVRYEHRSDAYCGLWISNVDGSNQRRILVRPDPIDIGDNEWTLDGKKIIFANGQAENASQDYVVSEIDIETLSERQVLQRKLFHIKNMQVLGDGRHFLLTANERIEEPSKIWKVNLYSGELVEISHSNESYIKLSISRDGEKLVATTKKEFFQIHLYDVDNPNKFDILPEANSANFFSSDRVIFSSEVARQSDIWIIDRDGRSLKQLTNESSKDRFPLASADGRFIYFSSNRSGSDQICRIDVNGQNWRQLTTNVGGYPSSADSEFVYYRKTGDFTLWKVPIEGGPEQQVLNAGDYSIKFSRDRSRFAFFRTDSTGKWIEIHSLRKADRPMQLSIPPDIEPRDLAWAPDGESIFLIMRNADGEFVLWNRKFDSAEATRVFGLGKMELAAESGFEFSPDGSRFLLVRGHVREDPILIDGIR